MLDGISKYLRLALAVFLGILLRAKNDGLASVHAVNPVYHLVQTLHFLELLSIDIEEILLDRGVCPDAHHDDTSLLILITLAIDLLQHLMSRLDNGDALTRRSNQALLHEVPVLRQILAESICIQEHPNDRCHRLLLPQLLRTTGSIVLQMKA